MYKWDPLCLHCRRMRIVPQNVTSGVWSQVLLLMRTLTTAGVAKLVLDVWTTRIWKAPADAAPPAHGALQTKPGSSVEALALIMPELRRIVIYTMALILSCRIVQAVYKYAPCLPSLCQFGTSDVHTEEIGRLP